MAVSENSCIKRSKDFCYVDYKPVAWIMPTTEISIYCNTIWELKNHNFEIYMYTHFHEHSTGQYFTVRWLFSWWLVFDPKFSYVLYWCNSLGILGCLYVFILVCAKSALLKWICQLFSVCFHLVTDSNCDMQAE